MIQVMKLTFSPADEIRETFSEKSKKEELLMLFDRHCGRVRYDFFLRLQKSVGKLSHRLDAVIRETLEAIEGGIEKAVLHLQGGQEDTGAVLDGLRERQRRIERASRELTGLMDLVLEGGYCL
ncbi:MAG: hypothetical protein HPY75_03690 [Actinobacteria bacterium]|nr:hypothetical protein [Actinomycetota bacterium]